MHKVSVIGFFMVIGLLFQSCSTSEVIKFNLPNIPLWKDVNVNFVKSDDGVQLAYRESGNMKSDKALIFVPGSTMYGYYYIPFMKAISGKNLYIRVIDLRGHGNSGGKRGDVPHENSLVDDLNKHILKIKSVNPGIEIIIGGHSLGAGVCGRYLEKYGFDSVNSVLYISPFFHYKQPGMKDTSYVDVNYFKTIFGDPHDITQVYHPARDDPKLVRTYTKMMSIASMVEDYHQFSKSHKTRALFIEGKKDELFEWEEATNIFQNQDGIKYIFLPTAAHLDIFFKGGANKIKEWLYDSKF